jgi:hypothetical protein
MNAPRRSAFPRTVSAFLENKSSRSRHGRNALITGSTAQTKATHTKSSSLTSREKESVAGQVARTSSIPMAGIQPNIFQETQAKRSRVSSVQVVIKKKRKAEDTEGQENAAKKVASHLRFRASKKLANTEILNDKATISQECTGQMSKPSVANAMVVSRPNTTNGSEGIKESGLPKVQPLPKSDVMNTEICKEAGLVSIPGLGSKHSGQVVDKPTERPPAKSGGTIEETVSAAPSFPKYPTRPPVVGYSTAFEERNSIVSSKNTDAQSSAPLFLYSIYQKVYTETDDATKTPATQIINRSFTNIGDANVQAERLVSFAQQCQNLHNIQFRTQNMHHDENNCVSFTGIFSNVDGEVIGRKNYLNIWVQREISHEDHRALDEGTQFINNTLYILRLCKLTYPEANEEISPPSCLRATSALVPTREPLLSYISLSSQCFRQLGIFSELYTIKDSANHAARKLQLALSHQPDPMSIEMRKWQDSEHSRLAQKLLDLEKAKLSISARDNGGVDAPSLASTENGDGKSSEKKSEQEGCWWSEFNGLDGERYRLIVENIEVNGPRNI